MRGKTIVATFRGQREARTGSLYQYDYGQVLIFADLDLPPAYEVHFGPSPSAATITMIGGADGVQIPDDFLRSAGRIYAWVYLHEGDADGETEYTACIPVTARGEITDAEPTPEQQSALDAAIAALNAGVSEVEGIADAIPQTVAAALTEAKESGEFDGPPGEPGPAGADGQPGPAGRDGVSPTASVTQTEDGAVLTVTDGSGTTTATLSNGADGAPGADGHDGVSPTISTSEITGGHRLTIVDASGTTTVDVMDGTDGSDGSPGQDGSPGADGYSPTASVSKSGSTATITITDKNGTTTAMVTDGANGQDGQDGNDGATYTPSVSAEGVISWTNDGGKANPPSVSIKGPKGDPGQDGKDGSDYVLTAQDKADIAAEVTVPVQDVQVNGTSVLSNGVANVPTASYNALGVVKTHHDVRGVEINNGELQIVKALSSQVKNGVNNYAPITPSVQDSSAFYGLAKAAGDSTQSSSSNAVGTYTESAKSAISQMLNAPVTVSGTTPSITAKAGVQYVCGEVSTLTIVVPESGCIDVIFESGSTPTVLTVTPPTGKTMKWPDWFNPNALEANATYEINVLNGTLGAVGIWM